MSQSTSTGYQPDPKHASVIPDADGWSIELSSDATVVELALLMTRFGCNANVITADRLELRPTTPDLPCPTGEQIRDLFELGIAALRDGRFTPIRFECQPWLVRVGL